MKKSPIAIAALILWAATVITASIFFIKGNTIPTEDNRISVLLKPTEKAFVLAEMRMLLEGVQGITAGLASNNRALIESSARSIGMASAADVNPSLMFKLPAAFKQQGMAVHGQFDDLADQVKNGVDHSKLLQMLADQMSACVACHSTYQLVSE